jgi:hypothetical protein
MAKSVFRRYPSDDLLGPELVKDVRGQAAGEITEDFFEAPSGGIVGTLSVVLDDVSLSAVGALPIVGASALVLADATLSATSVLPGVGAASVLLDDVSLAASGVLPIVGQLSLGLEDASLSATSTLQDAAIAGELSVVLDDATLVAESTLPILGWLEVTLADALFEAVDDAIAPEWAFEGTALIGLGDRFEVSHRAPKEYAFAAFVQTQLDGYIRKERAEATRKVNELEEEIEREMQSIRRAAEARALSAGATQSLEARYLARQQEELERQRDIMLGMRRDQNVRNLKKGDKRDKRR